jgi:hypothetical protein
MTLDLVGHGASQLGHAGDQSFFVVSTADLMMVCGVAALQDGVPRAEFFVDHAVADLLRLSQLVKLDWLMPTALAPSGAK